MPKERPELRIATLMGLCLLYVQHAEGALAPIFEAVLKDPRVTPELLTRQTEGERKRTLGEFFYALRKRVVIEPEFEKTVLRFLRMRNRFVHSVSDVPGWKLTTKEGREAAGAFLVELLSVAFVVTATSIALLDLYCKQHDVDMFEDHPPNTRALAIEIEKLFGPRARKILEFKKVQLRSKPKALGRQTTR